MDSPIYLQMADILEDCIISGELQPGSKLPSVRELAARSKTNPNTVQKALQILSEKQLIYTKRTAGKFVREPNDSVDVIRKEKARQIIFSCKHDLSSLGYDEAEINALWKECMEDAVGNKEPA